MGDGVNSGLPRFSGPDDDIPPRVRSLERTAGEQRETIASLERMAMIQLQSIGRLREKIDDVETRVDGVETRVNVIAANTVNRREFEVWKKMVTEISSSNSSAFYLSMGMSLVYCVYLACGMYLIFNDEPKPDADPRSTRFIDAACAPIPYIATGVTTVLFGRSLANRVSKWFPSYFKPEETNRSNGDSNDAALAPAVPRNPQH